MNYRIKIKLPKNKVNQFAKSNYTPINISTLSNEEISSILNNYSNHIAIAKLVKSNLLHIGENKYIWDPSSQQLEFIKYYYTNPVISFADQNTIPGQNNTLDETIGRQMYFTFFYKNKANLNTINENYDILGLPSLNCIRYIGKNYYVPNNINPIYLTEGMSKKLPDPTPEIFEKMLRDFIKNKWVPLPLNERTFDKGKLYSTYLYNGQYYQVPRMDKKDPELLEVFYRVANEIMPRLKLEQFTIESINVFKENLSETSKFGYESYRQELPDCYNSDTNQLAKYFANEEDGINYFVPNYDLLPRDVREELQKFVETNNSIANLVFKNIESEQQDLLGIAGDFETEFKCSRDPRFVEFLNSLNTTKKQETNIFNYLFNALSLRGVQEINGRRSFDLSTDHFNTDKLNMPEFELYYRQGDSTNNKGWYVKSNTIQNEQFESSNFRLLPANFSPQNYRFDAVLQKNNKVYCILEFDGSFHFRPKNLSENFIQRLTADQIKSAFVEYINSQPQETNIQIIRIPEYGKARTKRDKWKDDFKTYIVNKLNGYLGNQQTSEQTKTMPLQRAAYKIIRLLKK